jgi:xanthine dehydrogenase YagR molybdenum-binding subunit
VSVTVTRTVGRAMARVDARAKVTGAAAYAYEHLSREALYAYMVSSPVARGSVHGVDEAAALALDGVRHVIWAGNAPRLAEKAAGELAVLQSPRIAYRGQIVALVVADSLPAARRAAALLRIDYEAEPHDVQLRADHPRMYKPDKVNPAYETDTEQGDFGAGLRAAAATVDVTYRTPAEHNNPMEPHATVAVWEDGAVTVYDSNQGSWIARGTIARTLGLEPERVRVVSPHVGGGFGSKGTPRPTVIAAVMAAQVAGRPVKLAATRQQMFAITGYRTPTIQRLRLGADGEGRLTAICHDVWEQTSTLQEFAEQTATVTRKMYASPNLRTTHRLVALDVPTPSWMRAPGECPGMFGLESAIDELAIACGIDPVRFRIINEPEVDPETGREFTSRNLVACLEHGAETFGWWERDPAPAARRDGRWLHGMGVAASTYPARRRPSQAIARAEPDGRFRVMIAAADIGTGARTVLTQIAADALEVEPSRVELEIGDSDLPQAMLAGGSMGTTSWGSAVLGACRRLRDQIAGGGPDADLPAQAHYDTAADIEAEDPLPAHSFGAQFCEVRVDTDSGEVQVARMLGVFAAGQIINPVTARSQFIGGMTMGIGMALHEASILDVEFGDYLNHDFAEYHIPVCADIEDIDALWIDERDARVNPLGAKGIGEIGIVGTAAAVANAVHHATGVRVRELPIIPARLASAVAHHPA